MYYKLATKEGDSTTLITKNNLYILKEIDGFINIRHKNHSAINSLLISKTINSAEQFEIPELGVSIKKGTDFDYLNSKIKELADKTIVNEDIIETMKNITMSKYQNALVKLQFLSNATENLDEKEDFEKIKTIKKLYEGVFNNDLSSINEIKTSNITSWLIKEYANQYESLEHSFNNKETTDIEKDFYKTLECNIETSYLCLLSLKEFDILEDFLKIKTLNHSVTLKDIQDFIPDVYSIESDSIISLITDGRTIIKYGNDGDVIKKKFNDGEKFEFNGVEYEATVDGLKMLELVNYGDYKFSGNIEDLIKTKQNPELKNNNKLKI